MTQPGNTDPATAQLIALETDIKEGRINEAIAKLKAFNAAYPTDVRVLLIDALIARARKDTRHELLALHRATTLAPRWARAFIEAAITLSREERYPEALTAIDTALELTPNDRLALDVAIRTAGAAGNGEVALTHLRKAHSLWPDDPDIDRQLGAVLTHLLRHDEAYVHWRAYLARHPDDTAAQMYFGTTLIALRRHAEACVVFENMLLRNPGNKTIEFHLTIARGESPTSQPKEVVQGIFDNYASHFDTHLLSHLKYGVPRHIAEIVLMRHGDNRRLNILDLGCGTGLVGVHVGRVDGRMVGVDLSQKMLEQARKRNIYSELHCADLLDALNTFAPQSFDCIIAADVFVYVGELSAVIPACFGVLRPSGALIFSCESTNDGESDLVLRPSKRYAHSRASIEALCKKSGFASCTFKSIELRLDANVPIAGFIATAEKA